MPLTAPPPSHCETQPRCQRVALPRCRRGHRAHRMRTGAAGPLQRGKHITVAAPPTPPPTRESSPVTAPCRRWRRRRGAARGQAAPAQARPSHDGSDAGAAAWRARLPPEAYGAGLRAACAEQLCEPALACPTGPAQRLHEEAARHARPVLRC